MLSRLSLRARLLLGVVLLAALGLVAADVATYRSLGNYLLSRVDSTLNAVHPAVEQSAFGGVSHGPGPDEIAPPGYCVQLRTLSERVLAGNCQEAPGESEQAKPDWPRAVSLPAVVAPKLNATPLFAMSAVAVKVFSYVATPE